MGYFFLLQTQYIVYLINLIKMSWTADREQKLRDLWKKGHTASQIAEIIGGTTRNAVIGKAHRLNLEARAISKKTKIKTKTEINLPVKEEKMSRKARF